MRDLELLHHFTVFTSETMATDSQHFELWRTHVPQMAFSNRFLLHGILALSALHIRYESPEHDKERLMSVARYHQQHALTLYIPMLQTITEQNVDALFCFSLLLSCLCYAMLQAEDVNPHNAINQVLDVFDALMGCTAIAVEGKDWLYNGRLRGILLALRPEEQDFTSLDYDTKCALSSLRRCVDSSLGGHTDEESAARHKAHHKAIWALAAVMATTPGQRQLSIVCSWPVMVEGEFISMLKRRDPLALVIVGYYGVALHLFGRVWCMEGLGRKLTEAIYQELDVRWQPYMIWAVNKVSQPISQQATPSGWDGTPDPEGMYSNQHTMLGME